MRALPILVMVCVTGLFAACGGNGDGTGPTPPPTATLTSAAPSPAEVISLVQQYQVLERPEGEPWGGVLVPLASRVEKFCMDTPKWSAREGTISWRVYAECTKEESIPADNPLRFEWLFYPAESSVMPHSHAAHVVQYQDPW